jgi:hypothetical protein
MAKNEKWFRVGLDRLFPEIKALAIAFLCRLPKGNLKDRAKAQLFCKNWFMQCSLD